MKNWDWTRLDEAMLQVKMNYSSKTPQLKWIREAYYRLRDEEKQEQRSQHDQRVHESRQGEDQQLQLERSQCLSRLEALDPPTLRRAIDLAENQIGRFSTNQFPTEVPHMSWLHRFAILHALEESSGDV